VKSGFCAIVGRPSAGKSTLLNAILGEKVSIVSPSPQTTRNKVRGIYTLEEEGQIVFVDTPGYHSSEKKFNQYMMELVDSTLVEDADLILYVIDVTRKPGKEEEMITEMLQKAKLPMMICLNKMDAPKNALQEILPWLESKGIPAPMAVSAKEETNLEELKKALIQMAPEGGYLYPPEYYTDQPPEFRIAEIIREETINRLNQELPHALYIEVSDLEIDQENNKMWIRAFIQVEKESQKGIVVGKGGGQIKAIRQSSQRSLGKIFTQRIHLDLRVKVNPKWRRKDGLLKDLLS